jgi:hypothetical protein
MARWTQSPPPPALLEPPALWIFLSDAFLSVVAERDNPAGPRLLVRARRQGDIEWVFAEADTVHVPHADDAFRAWLPRGYPNCKDSISDQAYHDAALAAWSAMHRYQQEQLLALPVD